MLDRDKVVAKMRLSWKKNFNSGVVIPHNLRYCREGQNNSLCDKRDKIVTQRKEFTADINELQRRPPDENSHMLPWYKEK